MLLPGFRVTNDERAALRTAFPECAIENYLDWCGCFHTAAAFGLGALFDAPPSPRLYVHLNRRSGGHWMLIAARVGPAPQP
jgi:hypothetical protein